MFDMLGAMIISFLWIIGVVVAEQIGRMYNIKYFIGIVYIIITIIVYAQLVNT